MMVNLRDVSKYYNKSIEYNAKAKLYMHVMSYDDLVKRCSLTLKLIQAHYYLLLNLDEKFLVFSLPVMFCMRLSN